MIKEDRSIIKTTGATFTPEFLADFISKKILKYSTDHSSVLDPSCGDGALLDSFSKLNKDLDIFGYDINKEYINSTETTLKKYNHKVNLFNTDFLESVNIEKNQVSLFDVQESNICVDVVIANPPYVRTQNLGGEYSQYISKKYNLKGKIDLYFPFLIAMTNCLKEEGIIGVITSNKYLYNKSGESIREFLYKNYEILEVIDLGDTKLFDAAVLPAIFIGRKKRNFNNVNTKFTKLYQVFENKPCDVVKLNSVYDLLNSEEEGFFQINNEIFEVTKGIIRFNNSKENNWVLLNKSEADFIDHIHSVSKNKIKDFFKVRVGIKTTADKVFIKEDWSKENYVPEKELLHELISQENIKAWSIDNELDLKILYPHFDDKKKRGTIELDKFPNTNKYLHYYYDILSARDYLIKSNRQWYEIWVPQNPYLWKFPKIVFPDISIEPRFSFDDKGRLVNGNCYWIVGEKKTDLNLLLFIQGICNSVLMQKYHSLMFNNKLYSGRKRYFSQYIENYPLPNYQSDDALSIIEIVKKLNSKRNDKTKLLDELNNLIYKIYEIKED